MNSVSNVNNNKDAIYKLKNVKFSTIAFLVGILWRYHGSNLMKFYSSFSLSPENLLLSRGLNYGDGLFETMLIANGTIKLWDLHWQRLTEGLDRLSIEVLSEKTIVENIKSLVPDKASYLVKLVAFRRGLKRGYTGTSSQAHYYITVSPYNTIVSHTNCLTVSSIKLAQQTKLAGVKHLNRLEQVMAANEISKTTFSDAIMCDEQDSIIETISKNIILIKDDQIYTPKLEKSGVFGVALRWLLLQGFDIIWKKIEINDLSKYHAMMVCNSIQGFDIINNINNTIHFTKTTPLTHKIIKLWQENNQIQ